MLKYFKPLIFVLAVILFAIVISVNFSKPFGFFRESNSAMVCINAISWQQDEVMKNKHIPMVSYGFDKSKKPGTQLYNASVTFGYAWFTVPYYFLKILHLPANEITIRVFSLFWLMITLVCAFLLTNQLLQGFENKRAITYLTLLLYVFSAVALWYHVQGYVHEVAVLPFYFLSWLFFARYIDSKGTSIRDLACLIIMLFVSIQFDWLPAFQAGVMSIYLLINRKKINHKLSFALPSLAVVLGAVWIVYTFSDWATLPVYIDHLKEKFLRRTVGGGGLSVVPWLNYNLNILVFYATGYSLLMAVFLYGLMKKRNIPIVWLMIFTSLFHHVIFWGFSTEHDHAVIKMVLPVCIVSASVLSSFSYKKITVYASIIIASNVATYFFLHNVYKRPGIYENPLFCYQVGEAVRTKIPANEKNIFINTEGKYFSQIEFYAGKNYVLVNSLEEAQEILHHLNDISATGYFVNVKDALNIKILVFR